MQFPAWTNSKRKSVQATNRLRYILNQLAMNHSKEGNIASLARQLKLHHSTITRAIQNGAFTVNTAWSIQETLGRDVVTVEQLTKPLEIESTK